jgi:hypothetical protein
LKWRIQIYMLLIMVVDLVGKWLIPLQYNCE